ncbi:MAG: cysteine--tRNA ligase [Pseudomonadota bacterium]|nr:cysteine--tRNA ligase [Pseudomonadota bacterium]
MSLSFYNTLTRTKQPFAPIDPARVRMYVCGPTVYDYAHIGNGRAAIVFDLVFRLLRQVYGEDRVIYARNVTDVDDKINARAARDFPGVPLNEAIARVTSQTLAQYRDDVAALGCLAPTHEPRATDHIAEMRALIERLVARGIAYVAEDHVLFSPGAMDALPRAPRYGSLARRPLDEMLAGARVEVAPYKRDPMDFVLWKPSKPGEPSWPSPAGVAAPGRPGWHIECSAMSMKTLLEPFGGGLSCEDADKNVFDIHGGGVDLVFPHHENEIAQSCCAFGSERMANVWMHNGFLQVEGEKMSKSLGNFVTIRELLDTQKFGDSNWPGDVLRLAMLRTHYRDPIDWTARELERALQELREWYQLIQGVSSSTGAIDDEVINALCDDLNTHAAIVRLQELKRIGHLPALRASLDFLGFTCDHMKLTRRMKVVIHTSMNIESSASVAGTAPIAIERSVSSTGRADGTASVRGVGGWFALDPDGTYSTDPSTQQRIDDLIARRKAARAARNFAEADKLRDELAALGVAIKDNKDGTTTWEPKR